MNTTTPSALLHERFCLPRPGASAPRIEVYDAARYGEDGITQVGVIRVTRCIECGNATYDGVARG